ncbi:protoporphyrinogen oxidase [Paenibacillus yanchengensis]|uniref:Coproporphyrinogen III oxidase n=1 Tax=Paenibacillus yanchengensis TaxID=2035833 RepID=A0ABW4YG99_9BACL
MRTIAIIGGGITGISTAYYLEKQLAETGQQVKIVLIEREEKLGGKINTQQEASFLMEVGADSIVARKQNVAPLLEELNLADEVVYNTVGVSYLYNADGLKRIPPDTIFGIPMTVQSLAESELISDQGKVAALKDIYTPNEKFTAQDSIGHFLKHFFGEELVDKQIAPVLSGVYSGNIYELTLANTLPYLLEYKNTYGSIIKGLEQHKAQFQQANNKKFISFANGLDRLPNKMAQQLKQTEILQGIAAEHITKQHSLHDSYVITLSNGETINADYVILSTLHTVAQQLLQDEQLDTLFSQLKTSSLISMYLGYALPDATLPADGTGFIVAGNSALTCNACTWTSRKWEHTSAEQRLLLRLFYKSNSTAFEKLCQMDEQAQLQFAKQEIKASLKIIADPVEFVVTKWTDTMPNYHLQHPQIVKQLEQSLQENYPGMLLAGCSYYGVGIPDCIQNGEQTAKKIIELLR